MGWLIRRNLADMNNNKRERKIRRNGLMPIKTKLIIFSFIILLGAALFSYGAFFHSTEITAPVEGGSVTVSRSERALVKDASVGGVARDESGKIKQTYNQGEKPPETCST